MIVLISSSFSSRIGRLLGLVDVLKEYNTNIVIVPVYNRILKENPESRKEYFKSLVTLIKKAKIVLFHIQPSKRDFRHPYHNYIPNIYSFLYYHPSIKAKTFVIQPFYYSPHSKFYSHSQRLKQIFADKIRLGDFKEIPFDSLCTLPATFDQALKLHAAIIDFIEK